MSLIALAVIAAFAVYIMTPDERLRLVHPVRSLIAGSYRARPEFAARKKDPFTEGLRERTPYALVVPAIATVNVMVFVMMVLTGGAPGDPNTLVAWGGNFGPKTTNVEWGRLLVSMFVHAGPLHLLVTITALVQAGLIMERLAGYFAFSTVFAVAGFFASAVSLWLHPMDVSVGASGAVFGIYGFLVATSIWGLGSSGVMIPLRTLATLTPVAALFVLYNVLGGGLRLDAELAGCAAGFVSGLVLTRHVRERKPAALRTLSAVAVTFTVAAAIAIPLYGLVDVRPEIKRMVTLEDGSAARYDAALARFKTGVISAKDLAHVIERNIVPELQVARSRLAALGRIPREHQALVARAKEFLNLREQSWRVRAEALEVGSMAGLRKADVMETTSLRVLATLEPSVGVLEPQ